MTGVVLKHALSERGDDLYETPPVAVEALLRHERLPHRLWDPCCGPGNIVNVLRAAGHEVIGSDLVDYGDPTHFYRRDFLMERKAPDGCEGVVMNAPFKLAAEFVAHALDLSPLVIALLRLAFIESERRTRDPRRPWPRAHPRVPQATADDAPRRLGGPQGKQRRWRSGGSSGIAAMRGRRRSIGSRGSDHDPPQPARGRNSNAR